MTKIQYASIYAVLGTLVIFFLLHIGKNANVKGKSVRRQLHLVLVMDAVYFLSFFFENTKLLSFCFSFVEAIELWVLVAILNFSFEFAGSKIKIRPFYKFVAVMIVVADTIIMVINAGTQTFFGMNIHYSAIGEAYVIPEISMLYIAHLIICGIVEIAILAVLIYRASSVSFFYRRRFIILSITFIIGFLTCLIFRIAGVHMNFPAVILFTIGEIVIFQVYYRIPETRLNAMKNYVISNVSLPIVMFDHDDMLQVYNEKAIELKPLEVGMTLNEFIEDNNLKFVLTPERRRAGKTKEFTLTIKHDQTAYLIHGQELWDKDKYFIGTLLVYNDISNQEKLKDEATYHATRDSLTGLWNREYFQEMTAKMLKDNPETDFLIIVSDIYRFKMFNDILGKRTGDDLLLTIAKGFEDYKREKWIFSRMSGDRFALLVPVKEFDERTFVKVVQSMIDKREYALTVHFYLGIYEITDRTVATSDMCDRAFMALESIKGSMRTNVAYYDEEIRNRKLHETLNAEELEHALRNKQFAIYLQPQVDAENKKLIGAEALVRWTSPTRGIIPPNEFIPAFEENGMIAQLDYYVWEMACAQLSTWKKAGRDDFSISVNISAKDFYISDIYRSLTELVEKYNINPRSLKLEITETAFVLNVKEQMALVKKLQKYGFIVEIDDFGSGYSSLNSLKDISVDVLKLDMKFFEKTGDDDRAEKIVESVVKLAYNLKMPVIAEGVEEEEQVDMLRRIGCNIIQGYYFAKPMPVAEFEEFAKDYSNEDIHELIQKLKNND